MHRCIELAQCGRAHAAPNPMVGAVIVHQDRIIGEGYHIRCGEAHAEVNAINSVGPADRPLLRDSTLYVSLEPCAHFGRTPPCARLIVRTGIPRVVVGCIDPFAKVQGRGISIMREAGIDVTVGVCEQECLELNRRFITFQTKGRPYITLKWAESSDGYIDRLRDGGRPALLSTPRTLMHVHQLRAEHTAILVGHRTLQVDHPQLNIRHWVGSNPVKIVLGTSAKANCRPDSRPMPTSAPYSRSCTAAACSRCSSKAAASHSNRSSTRSCGTKPGLSTPRRGWRPAYRLRSSPKASTTPT